MIYNEIKKKLVIDKKDLSSKETAFVFNLIMSGKVKENDIEEILIKLNEKGINKNEIFGATKIMRQKSMKIFSPVNSIDTCGTGGDMSGTLNISTSSALIAASAGATVAKHGNRSVSSNSGSADMLEKLGMKILSEKNDLENALINHNFCFLFAQYHHPAMKHVLNVRKKLKKRTIFNLLGPLTNPANTKKQLLGVFDKKWVRIHCEVLKEFGSNKALVVHGEDGMDEISLCCPTYISELNGNVIKDYIFDPKDFGYQYISKEEILGKDPEYNAKAFIDLLEGQNNSFQKIVEINAGAALYLAGKTGNLKDGFSLANQTITTQKSKNYFYNLIKQQ